MLQTMSSFAERAATHWRDSELNAEVVVLAENLDGSGRRIELQRALSRSDQDRALGQDTYCLVTTSGATHYGGIDHWALEEGELRLSLSTEAATALGLDTELSIRLPADAEDSAGSRAFCSRRRRPPVVARHDKSSPTRLLLLDTAAAANGGCGGAVTTLSSA